MIINFHAHLMNKNHFSDAFWDAVAEGYAKSVGITKEAFMSNVMPQMWASDASVYVKVLEEAGIDKSIIHHPDWGLSKGGEAPWSIEEINKWYADQAADYPDKLIPICGCDPRRGEKGIQLIEKAVTEWGMKGVKIYPPAGFYPDDPKLFPFYEKVQELGVPLHSHTAALTATLGENKYANPIYLDSIAANFPDLKVVLVHFGGGFMPWSHTALELITGRANIYAEISGQQASAVALTREWLTFLRGVFDTPAFFGSPPKDRIMFGSDWPYLVTVMEDAKWVEFIKNIPEKAQEYDLKFKQREIRKLLGENAKLLLGL